jgi:hypothetical protein
MATRLMKLKRNDIIVYSPQLTMTIGNPDMHEQYAIGVVAGYDKYAECYDVEVEMPTEYGMCSATITSDVATADNIKVIGTLYGE